MKDLNELIDEYRCTDPADTTRAIFDAVRLPDRYRQLFFAVVRDECRRTARAHTVASFSDTTDDHSGHDTHKLSVVGRVGFLTENIYCGAEHGYIPLGEMTVEHHQARIVFQASLANGIQRDIQRHQDWIDEIVEANVSCLNDLHPIVVAS